MKNWILITGLIVLICSGVIGITVKVNVHTFDEAWSRVIEWKDEVFIPMIDRGFKVE